MSQSDSIHPFISYPLSLSLCFSSRPHYLYFLFFLFPMEFTLVSLTHALLSQVPSSINYVTPPIASIKFTIYFYFSTIATLLFSTPHQILACFLASSTINSHPVPILHTHSLSLLPYLLFKEREIIYPMEHPALIPNNNNNEKTKRPQAPERLEREDQETNISITGMASALVAALDWRGRPSNPAKHGGMRPAAFVLGLQAFEIMAIGAVGNNLITYVMNEMHFSLARSANIVTNFVGTIFLLALLGGYLSDSYLGSFWTILIFGFVELSGFILLSVQAHVGELKPPACNMMQQEEQCIEAKGFKAMIFFVAIYLVALGSGCVKPNMIAHGADQFDQNNPKQLKSLSSYFNAAYLAFSIGQLVALTLLVWVQTHSGMDVGFGISAAVMAIGLISLISGTFYYRNKPPQGSILTPIAQVFVAAVLKRKQVCASNPQMLHGSQGDHVGLHLTDKFRFLDKACMRGEDGKKESPWRLCSVEQVAQVKTLLSVIPIFACTIVFNTILAQLQTLSVQQGSAMDTHLTKSFRIPPATLQSIPYMLLIVLVPLYDAFVVPMARKMTGHESGISPLRRIGCGLFLASFSMVAAAVMEKKRRDAAVNHDRTLSIFWITPQFLIFGLSEMLTAVGLIEFFYKQSLKGMQAFLTAITYCSYSFGFYLSSVLVTLVNNITSSAAHGGWLHHNDLNKDRLDLFYWLLASLSFLNFLNYLFWSNWYSSPVSQPHPQPNANNKYLGGDHINNNIP